MAATLLMIDVQLDYDALHYTAYLAPVAAQQAGRLPLLDVFCQYGQAYQIYAAAFLLLPATYHAAALVTAVVNVLYTFSFIVLLRKVVRNNLAFALLGTLLPIIFSLQFSHNRTPSLGGVRYLPVVLVGVALVLAPARRLFTGGSLAAIVLCWLWSLEAAVYGTFVYISYAAAVSVTASAGLFEPVRRFLHFAARLILVLLFFAAAILIVYQLGTGRLPRYDLYVDQVLAYVGPDPFMEYNFFRQGFFAWAPVLVGFFVVPCAIVQRWVSGSGGERLPEIAVVWAVTISLSIYCLQSTQPIYVTVGFIPLVTLLAAALDLSCRSDGPWLSASQIGLGLVFIAVIGYFAGVSGYYFSPPTYSSPSNSALAELIYDRRVTPPDFAERLGQMCDHGHDLEVGSVCSGQPPLPDPYFDEFISLVRKWQGEQPSFFAFYPATPLMSAVLHKPQRLPVTFSYVDGFAPALFKYTVERSTPIIAKDLKPGDTLIVDNDLMGLNELDWALLKVVAAHWKLAKVEGSEHFSVVRLETLNGATDAQTLKLPDRPVKLRNSF